MKGSKIAVVVLILVVSLMAILAYSQPASAQAQPAISLKVGQALSETDPISASFINFERKVTAATDGKVTWNNYFLGSLVKPMEELEGLRRGLVDFAGIWLNYYPSQLPLNNFTYGMLFNTADPVLQTKITQRLLQEVPELRREQEKYNSKIQVTYCVDSLELTSNVPVKTLADLKGLKIACSGVWHPKWLQAVGAVPVSMPAGSRYTALQTGVVDGQILGVVATGKSFRLNEVSKYATIMGIGCQYAFWAVNLDTWKTFTPQTQDIINKLSPETEMLTAEALVTSKKVVLEEWRKQGIQVFEFSQADRVKWAQTTPNAPWLYAKEADAAGLPGTKVVETYLKIAKELGHQFPIEYVKQ